MGKRRDRFDLRQVEQRESKAYNGPRKAHDRGRREVRLLALLKEHPLPPFSRVLRDFIAAQANKKPMEVTSDDAKSVLAQASAS